MKNDGVLEELAMTYTENKFAKYKQIAYIISLGRKTLRNLARKC
jgi:hypothetical protein